MSNKELESAFEKEIDAVNNAKRIPEIKKALDDFKRAVLANPDKATPAEMELAESIPNDYPMNAILFVYQESVAELLYD